MIKKFSSVLSQNPTVTDRSRVAPAASRQEPSDTTYINKLKSMMTTKGVISALINKDEKKSLSFYSGSRNFNIERSFGEIRSAIQQLSNDKQNIVLNLIQEVQCLFHDFGELKQEQFNTFLTTLLNLDTKNLDEKFLYQIITLSQYVNNYDRPLQTGSIKQLLSYLSPSPLFLSLTSRTNSSPPCTQTSVPSSSDATRSTKQGISSHTSTIQLAPQLMTIAESQTFVEKTLNSILAQHNNGRDYAVTVKQNGNDDQYEIKINAQDKTSNAEHSVLLLWTSISINNENIIKNAIDRGESALEAGVSHGFKLSSEELQTLAQKLQEAQRLMSEGEAGSKKSDPRMKFSFGGAPCTNFMNDDFTKGVEHLRGMLTTKKDIEKIRQCEGSVVFFTTICPAGESDFIMDKFEEVMAKKNWLDRKGDRKTYPLNCRFRNTGGCRQDFFIQYCSFNDSRMKVAALMPNTTDKEREKKEKEINQLIEEYSTVWKKLLHQGALETTRNSGIYHLNKIKYKSNDLPTYVAEFLKRIEIRHRDAKDSCKAIVQHKANLTLNQFKEIMDVLTNTPTPEEGSRSVKAINTTLRELSENADTALVKQELIHTSIYANDVTLRSKLLEIANKTDNITERTTLTNKSKNDSVTELKKTFMELSKTAKGRPFPITLVQKGETFTFQIGIDDRLLVIKESIRLLLKNLNIPIESTLLSDDNITFTKEANLALIFKKLISVEDLINANIVFAEKIDPKVVFTAGLCVSSQYWEGLAEEDAAKKAGLTTTELKAIKQSPGAVLFFDAACMQTYNDELMLFYEEIYSRTNCQDMKGGRKTFKDEGRFLNDGGISAEAFIQHLYISDALKNGEKNLTKTEATPTAERYWDQLKSKDVIKQKDASSLFFTVDTEKLLNAQTLNFITNEQHRTMVRSVLTKALPSQNKKQYLHITNLDLKENTTPAFQFEVVSTQLADISCLESPLFEARHLARIVVAKKPLHAAELDASWAQFYTLIEKDEAFMTHFYSAFDRLPHSTYGEAPFERIKETAVQREDIQQVYNFFLSQFVKLGPKALVRSSVGLEALFREKTDSEKQNEFAQCFTKIKAMPEFSSLTQTKKEEFEKIAKRALEEFARYTGQRSYLKEQLLISFYQMTEALVSEQISSVEKKKILEKELCDSKGLVSGVCSMGFSGKIQIISDQVNRFGAIASSLESTRSMLFLQFFSDMATKYPSKQKSDESKTNFAIRVQRKENELVMVVNALRNAVSSTCGIAEVHNGNYDFAEARRNWYEELPTNLPTLFETYFMEHYTPQKIYACISDGILDRARVSLEKAEWVDFSGYLETLGLPDTQIQQFTTESVTVDADGKFETTVLFKQKLLQVILPFLTLNALKDGQFLQFCEKQVTQTDVQPYLDAKHPVAQEQQNSFRFF
ncbi:MAG: hypothetical protein V4591_01480 [Bdellovibrionota bacterium]